MEELLEVARGGGATAVRTDGEGGGCCRCFGVDVCGQSEELQRMKLLVQKYKMMLRTANAKIREKEQSSNWQLGVGDSSAGSQGVGRCISDEVVGATCHVGSADWLGSLVDKQDTVEGGKLLHDDTMACGGTGVDECLWSDACPENVCSGIDGLAMPLLRPRGCTPNGSSGSRAGRRWRCGFGCCGGCTSLSDALRSKGNFRLPFSGELSNSCSGESYETPREEMDVAVDDRIARVAKVFVEVETHGQQMHGDHSRRRGVFDGDSEDSGAQDVATESNGFHKLTERGDTSSSPDDSTTLLDFEDRGTGSTGLTPQNATVRELAALRAGDGSGYLRPYAYEDEGEPSEGRGEARGEGRGERRTSSGGTSKWSVQHSGKFRPAADAELEEFGTSEDTRLPQRDRRDGTRLSVAESTGRLTEGEAADGNRRAEHSMLTGGALDPPDVESLDKFTHRAGWLVGLLIVQSTSSLILKSFEQLIKNHPIVVYFLTMLIGAGGNAGSQSTVLAIRGLALGKIVPGTRINFIFQQMRVGLGLSFILFVASWLRVYIFDGNLYELLAVCVSMWSIVITSVFLGTIFPLALRSWNIDPAHAGAAIQVTMDIVGCLLTCSLSWFVLDVCFRGSSTGKT